MKTCIYTITNILNHKIYVGCTTDFSKRKSDHLKKLRQGIHKNNHLQASFNKNGEDKFLFEILEECDRKLLASLEHYWCNLLNVHSKKNGYNQRPTHPYGKIINTPEMIESFRKKMKGRKLSPESIAKRTETRKKIAKEKGYYHSQKTKDLMSKKKKNSTVSEEIRKKISENLKGRKLSKEHIKNAINGRKGYKHSEETKKKIGNGNRKKIKIP